MHAIYIEEKRVFRISGYNDSCQLAENLSKKLTSSLNIMQKVLDTQLFQCYRSQTSSKFIIKCKRLWFKIILKLSTAWIYCRYKPMFAPYAKYFHALTIDANGVVYFKHEVTVIYVHSV